MRRWKPPRARCAAKDAPDIRALFVQCVRNADRLPPVQEFRALMIRAPAREAGRARVS